MRNDMFMTFTIVRTVPKLMRPRMQYENQKWMKDQGLPFVAKDQNPPNAPQIRPIERFWAILKFLVYEGNWSPQNRVAISHKIMILLNSLYFALQTTYKFVPYINQMRIISRSRRYLQI